MNRTASSRPATSFCLFLLAAGGVAQEPVPNAEAKTQEAAIKELVAEMMAVEATATRIRLELVTQGWLPDDLEFQTKGSFRVLKSAQGAVEALHSVVEYTFADGLTGRMEAVRTPDGVRILERDPTFGEVYVRIDPALLADLEWASGVMKTEGFGVGNARTSAPLGSAMVEDLAQRYRLERVSRHVENGQAGTWYGGERKQGPGQAGDQPGLPLADRVEMFVRDEDKALLEVVFLQAGKPVQRIRVDDLVLGEAMPIESFTIESDQKLVDVREHQPMWEQIRHLLDSAEKESGEPPPSKRD